MLPVNMILLVLGQGVKVRSVGEMLSKTAYLRIKKVKMVKIIDLFLTLEKEDKKEVVERLQDQCLIKASKDQFLVLLLIFVCVYVS